MRLAYLTSRFPYAYIGETFFTPEVRLLARLCEELHVIPARPQFRQAVFSDLGTINVRIPPGGARTVLDALLEGACHPVLAARAFWRIASPRYAIAAKVRNLVLFPKALAAARYVRKQKIDHIHAHWMTTSSTIAYVASMMTGIPWSCTAHAHDIFSDNLLGEKVRSARFVRVIAERNRRHLAANTQLDARELQLIHLGVEVPPSPLAARDTDRPLQIVCIARLDPIKGLDDLLASLAIVRDHGLAFHCDIAGNGPLLEHLRGSLTKLNLVALVTLRGLVEHHMILEELRAGRYDVLVLPSLELEGLGQHEGIPIALMEAMAATVPCIATATGCIPELIDSNTGLLVEQRNPDAIAGALVRIAGDRAFARELGNAARERIAADFNVEKTTRALYDLICECSGREPAGGHSEPRPVAIPMSMPSPHANCNAGKNANVATVTSDGSSLARPQNTHSA